MNTTVWLGSAAIALSIPLLWWSFQSGDNINTGAVRRNLDSGRSTSYRSAVLDRPAAERLLDPVLRRSNRRHADSDQAFRVRLAELREPTVVRFETSLLVRNVFVLADHHPGARVDHLPEHALLVLDREARFGIVARRVKLLPSLGTTPILEGDSGPGQLAARNLEGKSGNDELGSLDFIVCGAGPAIPEGRIDVRITVFRLVDVGVGRK